MTQKANFLRPMLFFLFMALAFMTTSLKAQSDFDFTNMSLEELMNIEVTSVSKKSQKLFESAAAIYVLTSDDIERSGVTNIPDALRLVPGVDVSRIDANKYAVSIRGLSARSSNKLLVLVNGRPIYDPLFAGVFWESRDVVLETIDRIEVTRGPGGAIWGANAVNGVINIISKRAEQTQGVLISGTAGTQPRGAGLLQFGRKLSNSTAFSATVHSANDNTGHADPEPHDDRQITSARFRIDHAASAKSNFSLWTNYFEADVGEGLTEATALSVRHSGGSINLLWKHTISNSNQISLQGIADYFVFDHPQFGEERHLGQFEFRQQFIPASRHEFIWGLLYQYHKDFVGYKPINYIDPMSRQMNVYSIFAQDEITIVKDKVIATVGSKLDHNDYTGYEIQPSVSIAWYAHPKNMIWGSASRAVRTPSRQEKDLAVGGIRYGDPFNSEIIRGYQVGNRAQLSNSVSLDAVAFVHDYDQMISLEADGFHNDMYGQIYGTELNCRWQTTSQLRVEGFYYFKRVQIHTREGSAPSNEVSAKRGETIDPRNVVGIRSMFDLTQQIKLDGTLRYVDHLQKGLVPSYCVADFRIAWQPTKIVTLSVAARDLFSPHHYEQVGATATEVEPSVYVRVAFSIN